MLQKLFTLLIMYILIKQIYMTDYCKLCKDKTHTMCKYKKGPSTDCANYNSINLTLDFQSFIINLHNRLRSKVALGKEIKGNPGPQPSAANMLLMKWDNELATIAQRWADQCISAQEINLHDECKTTDRFSVGQNVISTLDNKHEPPNFELMIMSWYNQVENLEIEEVTKFNGLKPGAELIGHYTQMVWASTQFVGCAHSSFKENILISEEVASLFTIHRLICNYGPSGNTIGIPVYKTGKPCSQCPAKYQCDTKYPALCQNGTSDEQLNIIAFKYNESRIFLLRMNSEDKYIDFQTHLDPLRKLPFIYFKPQLFRMHNTELNAYYDDIDDDTKIFHSAKIAGIGNDDKKKDLAEKLYFVLSKLQLMKNTSLSKRLSALYNKLNETHIIDDNKQTDSQLIHTSDSTQTPLLNSESNTELDKSSENYENFNLGEISSTPNGWQYDVRFRIQPNLTKTSNISEEAKLPSKSATTKAILRKTNKQNSTSTSPSTTTTGTKKIKLPVQSTNKPSKYKKSSSGNKNIVKGEVIYVKRTKGVWRDGRCRCNYAFRAKASKTVSQPIFYLVIIIFVMILF